MRTRPTLRLAAAQVRDARNFDVCKDGAAKRLLIDIREVTPAIAARVADFEAERRMPSDVVDVLKAIGAFRIFVPRSHGGLELDLPSGLAIIAALARLDGSVGWTAMIGSACSPLRRLAAAANLRSALCQRPRHDACRRLPACRDGRGDGRGLAGRRALALRQRMSSCRLAGRLLRDDRGRQAAGRAGWKGTSGPGLRHAGARLADRGHLVCRRPQGHGQSSHRHEGQGRPGGAFLRSREWLPGPGRTALPVRA